LSNEGIRFWGVWPVDGLTDKGETTFRPRNEGEESSRCDLMILHTIRRDPDDSKQRPSHSSARTVPDPGGHDHGALVVAHDQSRHAQSSSPLERSQGPEPVPEAPISSGSGGSRCSRSAWTQTRIGGWRAAVGPWQESDRSGHRSADRSTERSAECRQMPLSCRGRWT
jgi:hypothetical protein